LMYRPVATRAMDGKFSAKTPPARAQNASGESNGRRGYEGFVARPSYVKVS
jgi:hypothetical protein